MLKAICDKKEEQTKRLLPTGSLHQSEIEISHSESCLLVVRKERKLT